MKQFKNNTLEDLFTIAIIPDEQDYQEQMIDAHLKWICENDPHSPLKNFKMVDYQSEIDFLLSRQQELEQERDWRIHQRMLQLQAEVQNIQNTEPPESAPRLVGPDYVIQDRIEKYQQQEINTQKARCHEEIQLIAGRYNSLKQQCEERINQARANYQESLRIWQEERGWGLGNSG
ncbi:hypothetical protein [Nostoc sp. FACHB-110]|uniref:hypothetical protein n=1 Tax=Nostoc sp. FACHB-110 TaxID=2692834 RepID=UPI001683722A|nr:hypothetical protein [Nostoc sp. FACHB-110]MBD2436229.1 hypothetical protein [Nostoc sp. FACHB-110]